MLATKNELQEEDDLATLAILGLPSDVRLRELRALFRFAPGFLDAAVLAEDSSEADRLLSPAHCMPFSAGDLLTTLLSNNTGTPTLLGFARFVCRQDAMDARQHLHGKPFDPDEPERLMRISMAGKNLSVAFEDDVSSISFLPRPSAPCSEVQSMFEPETSSVFPVRHSIDTGSGCCHACGSSVNGPMLQQSVFYHPTTRYSPARRASSSSQHLLQMNNSLLMCENPPCNTLYVGNLPQEATEQELLELFAPVAGFRRLAFRQKPAPSGPMCFVEFESVGAATETMTRMYGTVLRQSSKGGIRLSYSKNPLGVRSPPQNLFIDDASSSMSSIYVYHPIK